VQPEDGTEPEAPARTQDGQVHSSCIHDYYTKSLPQFSTHFLQKKVWDDRFFQKSVGKSVGKPAKPGFVEQIEEKML
jgi:hypothetical protein